MNRIREKKVTPRLKKHLAFLSNQLERLHDWNTQIKAAKRDPTVETNSQVREGGVLNLIAPVIGVAGLLSFYTCIQVLRFLLKVIFHTLHFDHDFSSQILSSSLSFQLHFFPLLKANKSKKPELNKIQ